MKAEILNEELIVSGESAKKELMAALEWKTKIEKELVSEISELVSSPENKLGEGGTAVVYVSKQNKDVCFKIIKEPDILKIGKPSAWHTTISTEVDLLSYAKKVKSEVVVPEPAGAFTLNVTCDSGEEKTLHVLVMEALHGKDLDQIVSEQKALPDNFDIEAFFAKLRVFFKKLHEEQAVFHRDVALRNIMFLENGEPAVIDFGRGIRSHNEPYFEELSAKVIQFPTTDEDGLEKAEKSLRDYKTYLESLTK